jgi:hypothetical protein
MLYDSLVTMMVPLSAVIMHFSLFKSLQSLVGEEDEMEG